MNSKVNSKTEEVKHPPRVWLFPGDLCDNPLERIPVLRKPADTYEHLQHEYLSLSEHEAILGERINEGYEWTRKELNAKDREIAEHITKARIEIGKRTILESNLAGAAECLGEMLESQFLLDPRIAKWKQCLAEINGTVNSINAGKTES